MRNTKDDMLPAHRTRHNDNHRITVFFIVLSTICFWQSQAAAQAVLDAGAIKGEVGVMGSTGRSYVPATVIVLDGPEHIRTEADALGRFEFPSVLPSTYTIKATAQSLEIQQSVSVEAGKLLEISLDLQLVATTTDVTVSANSAGSTIAANTHTIEQKAIGNAANADQRFESLLPFIPGVVRGPDGRINMKGARSSQNGALVNSANVTDPASGGAAINLPIDVVSSVQVVSNPFDPQYGRFTGALSTVETKTGNYERSHFSIQNIVPRWRERAGTKPKLYRRAEMLVSVSCDGNGMKHFEVLSEDGWKSANKRVLHQMVETESDSSRPQIRPKNRITSENYSFRMIETGLLEGRMAYVMEAIPKREDKALFRGRIWVDAEDYAFVRIEGEPAKNPSFWTRKVHFVQQYYKSGSFWFPLSTTSVTTHGSSAQPM
jgi:hypothetical protein